MANNSKFEFEGKTVAITGKTVGPGIFELLLVMGKEMSIHRINDVISSRSQS